MRKLESSMVKRFLAVGTSMPWLLTSSLAAAQPAEAGAATSPSTGASTSAAAEPVPDPAASAGAAPQETATDDESYWDILGEDNPNPATYEISFVSIGLNQLFGLVNWNGGGIYFGAGGGVGTSFYRIVQMEDRDVGFDPTLEAVFGNLFFRISPVRFVDLDLGGRLALATTTYDIDDAPQGGFVRGVYADLRVGSRKVKLGPRFEYDDIQYSDLREQGWKLTPLMLRVEND